MKPLALWFRRGKSNDAPDGCTGVPDGGARSCCNQHDLDYTRSGVPRQEADRRFRECLRSHGMPVRAWVFWVAVRCVGWAFYEKADAA